METVSHEGYRSPIVHIEYRGDELQLAADTEAAARRLGAAAQQVQRLNSASVLALEAGEDAEAWSQEFSHETQREEGDVFGTDEVIAELAAQAGWSEAELAARRAELDDGHEGTAALLDLLRDAVREKRQAKRLKVPAEGPADNQPIDAEFTPEAQVPGDAEQLADPDDPFHEAPTLQHGQATLEVE